MSYIHCSVFTECHSLYGIPYSHSSCLSKNEDNTLQVFVCLLLISNKLKEGLYYILIVLVAFEILLKLCRFLTSFIALNLP